MVFYVTQHRAVSEIYKIRYYQTTGDAGVTEETGAIPQSINYVVKRAFVLPFVENMATR
jgi:hypothetical protein